MRKPDLQDVATALIALLEENDRLIKELGQTKAVDNRPKLTEIDVKYIRQLRRDGLKIREIADIYDVNKSTISRILRGVYHK